MATAARSTAATVNQNVAGYLRLLWCAKSALISVAVLSLATLFRMKHLCL